MGRRRRADDGMGGPLLDGLPDTEHESMYGSRSTVVRTRTSGEPFRRVVAPAEHQRGVRDRPIGSLRRVAVRRAITWETVRRGSATSAISTTTTRWSSSSWHSGSSPPTTSIRRPPTSPSSSSSPRPHRRRPRCPCVRHRARRLRRAPRPGRLARDAAGQLDAAIAAFISRSILGGAEATTITSSSAGARRRTATRGPTPAPRRRCS